MADSTDKPCDGSNNPGSRTDRLITLIETSGGALAVALAITFTFVIALVTIPLAAGPDRVTIATAAFTGIGTIAGAYFGIRVGAEGKDRAEKGKERAEEGKELAEKGRERAEQDRQEAQLVVERVATKGDEGAVKEARKEVRQEQKEKAG